MLSVIAFVLSIGVLVFIHEFGHYYVAKSFGVKIEEFSIGFGKELYSRIDAEGVKWKICAIPLGGFVKMYGDSNPASTGHIEVQDSNKAFYTKSVFARFLIVAAGPIANYLLAIVILTCFYSAFGKTEVPAIIGEVIQNSPAEKAGLRDGDKIIDADGNNINDFSDLRKAIILNSNHEINLLISRNGEELKIPITPINKELEGNEKKVSIGYIGVKAKGEPIHLDMNPFFSFHQSVTDVMDISVTTIKAIGQMITGIRSLDEIYGPLTIATESGRSLSNGSLDFVLFISMLSINLGLVNLLPIPILDGGHLAFILYEAVTKKPLSIAAQNILLKIGMMIIVFLVVISISNDIKSLIF